MSIKEAYIECYGCNEACLECAHLQSYLEGNGIRVIGNPKMADLIIFWGCAFTQDKAEVSGLVARKLSDMRKPRAELLVWACLYSIDPSMVPKGRDIVAIDRRDVASLESYIGDKVRYGDITVNRLFPRTVRRWAELWVALTSDFLSFLMLQIRNKLCLLSHGDFVRNQSIF